MIRYDSGTKQIQINRGDATTLNVTAKDKYKNPYTFQVGEIVGIKITSKKDEEDVILEKEVEVEEETTVVQIPLTTAEMKIGEIINKPVTYWYEIYIDASGEVQTIIGYDEEGPKEFVLNPEASEVGDNNA